MTRLSNDTYGSNVLRSFEAAKGYTLPACQLLMPSIADPEQVEAHANILVCQVSVLIIEFLFLKTRKFPSRRSSSAV